MWTGENTCGSRQCRVALRSSFCAALCLASSSLSSFAQVQTGELLSVQPAVVKGGAVEIYGIVRGLGNHPTENGTVLAFQVTAAESDASTALRLAADGKPCPDCTTTHYFLVREPREENPEMLVRGAPGPVTYIHIAGKEYMVWGLRLSWTDGGKPKLERATLLQTGFAPPILKRRLRIRFDAPLDPGLLADNIAGMAMRDAMAQSRRAQKAYEAAVRESKARDAP